jgi:hypothetical protein
VRRVRGVSSGRRGAVKHRVRGVDTQFVESVWRRRARREVLAGVACFLIVAGAADGSGRAAAGGVPIPWPYRHLELGLASSPGGAGGLAAVAPFGFRYQYLAGGVNTGQDWPHWNPNGSFVSLYIAESEAHRIIPVFSYYEIRQSWPGAGVADEASADLGNLANVATMRSYYLTLELFYRRAASAKGPVVLQIEPDLFGYVEQHAGHGDASTVPAAVASTGVPALRGLPNTAAGFAQAVLVLRDRLSPRVIVGYRRTASSRAGGTPAPAPAEH